MKNYNSKYLNDSLILSELQELRQELENTGDAELDRLIMESWNEECKRDYDCTTPRGRKILKSIDRKIRHSSGGNKFWTVSGWVLSACLAAALVLSSASNIRKTWELTSRDVIIKTADGEKSTVILPDGSRINLNYGSTLSYNQADFIRGKRNVEFSGEAYFNIHKQNGAPFVINSSDLSVVVSGTRFNYSNRAGDNTSSLALFEGKVSLICKDDGRRTEISPGQIASFDRKSGLFELKSSDYIESMSAWTRGEIVFRRATLPRVLEILGHYYGYKVTASSEIRKLHNTFSGTLPLSDINDAMTVLELLYPINTVILEDKITVSMNK